jgi:hypothetical protein
MQSSSARENPEALASLSEMDLLLKIFLKISGVNL